MTGRPANCARSSAASSVKTTWGRAISTIRHASSTSAAVPYKRLYEGLASGRRLVTFDSRGVGGSQREVDDLAIPAQVADLAAVVDELGLEEVDLLGWTTGGAPAAAYAVEYPERVGRFVLAYPLVSTSDSPLRSMQDIARSIRSTSGDRITKSVGIVITASS